jgi:hypothetical protein
MSSMRVCTPWKSCTSEDDLNRGMLLKEVLSFGQRRISPLFDPILTDSPTGRCLAAHVRCAGRAEELEGALALAYLKKNERPPAWRHERAVLPPSDPTGHDVVGNLSVRDCVHGG